MSTREKVIHFWFVQIEPKFWFLQDASFDDQVRRNFLDTFERAIKGETKTWRETPDGYLAEVIVLDQFPRNMFRGKPEAFSGDELALKIAQEAVALGLDKTLAPSRRAFLYMPYMHSERKDIHEQAIVLFDQKGLENNLKFELLHKKIIDRFGRYPHRNKILGRASTPEEIEFLNGPNSSF